MIKHFLGNSQINSIPAWSKEFSYITFHYRTPAKVYALARADKREVKHDVYGRQQTAKITSDFVIFSCNP